MAGTTEPIRKSVTVARSVDDAFALFTEGMGTWWPFEGHSIGEKRVASLVFEPKQGGRVYELWGDGSQHHWAMVTKYDPPAGFVLSWQPNPDRPAPTEVEVRFIAEGSSTRVELEHRGWELLGEQGPEARDSYNSGWPATLGRYAEAAA